MEEILYSFSYLSIYMRETTSVFILLWQMDELEIGFRNPVPCFFHCLILIKIGILTHNPHYFVSLCLEQTN